MEKVTVSDWDPAEHIKTKEDVIAHLEVALEENDYEFLLETIGHIARSKYMAQLYRADISSKESPDLDKLFGMFTDGKLSTQNFIKQKQIEKVLEN
jgi:probable addiction module antidote protein